MKQDDTRATHCGKSRESSLYRLIEACKRKDIKTIKEILDSRPELVNQRDHLNRTLLHYASITIVDNQIDDRLVSPSEQNAIECFDFLTSRCEPKLWYQSDSDGLSILHLAVISTNEHLVRHIINEHENAQKWSLVNALDREHHSPLHWAVITNSLDCVRLLIEHSGTILAHQPDLNGATPLHYATQTADYPKYRRQLRQMLRGSTVTTTSTASGDTASSTRTPKSIVNGLSRVESKETDSIKRQDTIASTTNETDLEVLNYLAHLPQINLECLDKDHRTPLLWAASSGNQEAIELLANCGADVLSVDLNKLGALHCAASHGFTKCLECLLKLNSSPINQVDNLDCTPLFYAVLSGNIDCVETLLDNGALADWQDTKGRTAAHFAALKGQLNSLKLFEARGANLWLANKQGDLPLHYAIKSDRQQVIKWLLERSPYERAINAINNSGRAPIHLAVLRDNARLVDYLIKSGANLDQLVKVRDKTATTKGNTNVVYNYETALDMARRLKHAECEQILVNNGAQLADKVMAQRQVKPNARSFFELQSAKETSPIGFETSSSSAASPQCVNGTPSAMPQIPRPAPVDSVPQSDSTGSSALSQSSLSSIRGVLPNETTAPKNRSNATEDNNKPYKGGISYHNDRINAAIKCKFYERQPELTRHGRSFPTMESPNQKKQQVRTSMSQSASLDGPASQEIVTNVNVYTSPSCGHHCSQSACDASRQQQQSQHQDDEDDSDATSEATITHEEAVDDGGANEMITKNESNHLPDLRSQQVPTSNGSMVMRRYHLPPSQGCEQRLPVITSEYERSTSGTSNENTQWSPDHLDEEQQQQQQQQQASRRSPADEEPRFDRSQRGGRSSVRQSEHIREQVRSPVGEYIRAPFSANIPADDYRYRSSSMGRIQQYPQVDLSHIKPKVDSRRVDDGLDMSQHTPSRSVSRQTVIKTTRRQSSVDSFELASSVEKSIRKYKQETKLFEELQNLKRSQIRSGRANEALLVKRLVEHFRNEADTLIGLEIYRGPYTYRSYELYLYDQLRKLSQSNAIKLAQQRQEMEATQQQHQQRDYFEEDLRADMELRRVIGDGNDSALVADWQESIEPMSALENLVSDQKMAPEDEYEIVVDAKDEQIGEQERKEQDKKEELSEVQQDQSLSSSRRSSVDVEREKLKSLPLATSSVEQTIEDEARSLSSSIIVDALGNVSRISSAKKLQEEDTKIEEENQDDEKEKDVDETEETIDATVSRGRRRSVVNIGNKMEVIYHNVGIEIEPVAEHPPSESGDEGHQPEEVQQEEIQQEEAPSGGEETKLDEAMKPQKIQRRVSSPPAPPSEVSRYESYDSVRRWKDDTDASTTSSINEQEESPKKVFNGYDLDELHQKRHIARSKPDKTNLTTNESSRQQPETGTETSEIKPEMETPIKRVTPTTFKRRLERSRLPPKGSRRLKVQVPVEEVRYRWQPFKARGRRTIVSARGGSIHQSKSQPDLKQSQLKQGQLMEENCSNITLLYEINKHRWQQDDLSANANKPETTSAKANNVWICRRKVVRIVDVRTLKRTLSLPESIIYSNDLLKKFSILKL